MTFKDLEKLILNQRKQDNIINNNSSNNGSSGYSFVSSAAASLFEKLKGLPFYDWSNPNAPSFNTLIGLPQKDGRPMPLFDYEKSIFDALCRHKLVWVVKSTGLGISELCLRIIAYLCLYNDAMKGKQACIVTGPRIELAITLIDRIKRLFPGVIFNTKDTVVELNGCHIEAFPSHHLDAMRGLVDVKFILLDEADFFPPGEQQDARYVSERYIGKSQPYIIMVSTPNAPGGLYEQIDKEEPCLYHKLRLDYRVGLGKIYTHEEIVRARQSPSFAREYECQYLGLVGNVFKPDDIQAAINLGRASYDPQIINGRTPKVIAIDPAWGGSSAFGLVVTEQPSHSRINVLLAEEYGNRPSHEEMVQRILNIYQRYGNVKKIYCDSAASAFITSLKEQMGERTDWPEQIKQIKSRFGNRVPADYYKEFMTVVPIVFASEHRELLSRTKMLLEYSEVVAIHPQFSQLIAALTTAQEQEGKLLKHLTSHDDVLDAFRMACKHYDTIHSAEESQRIAATKKQQIGSGFVFSAAGTSRVQQPSVAEMQSRRQINSQIWQQAFNSDTC